ncbi:type II toxin-antitoxin system HipA family toxin [Acidisphaera sp. S103]|uniref:type II toxin-antitoxin system HipA family toxin n=1 Tax=Acidisphaera sp. S103 TaxID=1747223 RepID=UPI00131A69E6|nr:type II toxin-antitoxin system HipA family toxin [Acidisphaera sp. S103]
MSELIALLNEREVGTVRQDRGRLAFEYAESWRNAPAAYPLSLSMPLAAAHHGHASIAPYLWGLLPDSEFILSQWGQRFHVSPRNPFALLTHVGEDCAGAVQFVRPDRLEAFLSTTHGDIEWLTEADVANRLRRLQADASAWRAPQDTGQFSLAGAQPKTALVFDGQRWGVPSGREPTTHILKPATGRMDGHAQNEHLCLSLARALGLPAARSEVMTFEDVTAIVVFRYDRIRPAGTTHAYRVHQEDFCQALRVHPAQKYQNQGGPGPKPMVDLLRANASGQRPDRDVETFLDALILNWLIGGSDAHAKNYSILIGSGGLVRLAPLYDVASVLAYPDVQPRKATLAMKIGNTYRLHDIGLPEWRDLAAQVRWDGDAMADRVRTMATELPDRLTDEVRTMGEVGCSHPLIDRLAHVLIERATQIARQ